MKFCLVRFIVLLPLLATVSGCATPQERSDVLITNARLIDGTGRVREQAIIAISEDRIEGIFSDSEPREGDLTINAGGRTVMPGLIDSHVHVFAFPDVVDENTLAERMENSVKDNLIAFLSHGVTTIRSTGDPEDAILELRQLLKEGKIDGPRLFVVGPTLSDPEGHPSVTIFPNNPWMRERITTHVTSVDNAKETIQQLARKGVDGIKLVYQGSDDDRTSWYEGTIYDGQLVPVRVKIRRPSREVTTAVIEESHRHGLRVTAHTWEEEAVVAVVEAGVDSLEHGVVAENPVSERVIEVLRDAGVSYIATLQMFRDVEEKSRAMANLKQLSDGGVTIVLGTDTVGDYFPAGSNTISEAEHMVEAGMSPVQVIQAATRNAAENLGRGDDLGTLEAGKLADLIIVDGDPLEDISVLRTLWLVMKGGQIAVDNRKE